MNQEPFIMLGLGFVLGGVLAVLSFVLLTKIVVKILANNYTNKTSLVFLLFLKLVVIIGVLFLAMVLWKVNVVAFLAGYGACLLTLIGGRLVKK